MKDEVEDFLRRVAQMRAQAEAQAKSQQRPPAQQKPPPKPPRQQPPARLVPARPEPPPPQLVPADVVEAELADNADRVARQVATDMRGTDQIAEHTRHLGEEVDTADSKMKAHLHQVFDHQLGRLKSTSGETALVQTEKTAPELSLGQIVRMLRSPNSIRDAIVMSEILRRPE